MDGRELPGFYFDKEKKKYFRIQPSNTGFVYSRDNLRNLNKRKKVERAVDARKLRVRQERVTRRHASSLSHLCLDREFGARKTVSYVHSSWPVACVDGMPESPTTVVPRENSAKIQLFDISTVTGTIFAVHGESQLKRKPLDRPGTHGSNKYSCEPWEHLATTTSPISSLSVLPLSNGVAVTTYGSDREPIVYLCDPEHDGPGISEQFKYQTTPTIMDSAPRPTTFPKSLDTIAPTDTEILAVAAGKCLSLLLRAPGRQWDVQRACELDTEIHAVDWISHNTIAVGQRNGQINLYDTRSYGKSATVLTHPNAICRIKRADDETRVLCSGLENTLHLYDIRSCRRSRKNNHYSIDYFFSRDPGISFKQRKRMAYKAFVDWTQPVMAFPHSNIDDTGLSFDVDRQLGLVAAAQDSAISKYLVRVSNLWTGETIKQLGDAPTTPSWKPSCLRFPNATEFEDSGLWASWDGSIAQFRW